MEVVESLSEREREEIEGRKRERGDRWGRERG